MVGGCLRGCFAGVEADPVGGAGVAVGDGLAALLLLISGPGAPHGAPAGGGGQPQLDRGLGAARPGPGLVGEQRGADALGVPDLARDREVEVRAVDAVQGTRAAPAAVVGGAEDSRPRL